MLNCIWRSHHPNRKDDMEEILVVSGVICSSLKSWPINRPEQVTVARPQMLIRLHDRLLAKQSVMQCAGSPIDGPTVAVNGASSREISMRVNEVDQTLRLWSDFDQLPMTTKIDRKPIEKLWYGASRASKYLLDGALRHHGKIIAFMAGRIRGGLMFEVLKGLLNVQVGPKGSLENSFEQEIGPAIPASRKKTDGLDSSEESLMSYLWVNLITTSLFSLTGNHG